MLLLGCLLLVPVVAVRLVFLIRGPLGWITYLANTFSEFFVKKVRWSRTAVEMVMGLVGVALVAWGGGMAAGVLALVVLLGLELYVSKLERWMLATSYTPIDPIGIRRATPESTRGLARGYPTPSTHPELTVNVVGPFVERVPAYALGTLLVGRSFEIRLLVGNHTLVPTQTGIRVTVEAARGLRPGESVAKMLERLKPGEVHEVVYGWSVVEEAPAGRIRIVVEWGDLRNVLEIRFDRCQPAGAATPGDVSVTRYPGACRSAFAWRGDMDLYDESTLQSIEGLEVTLGLAARYRLPQTMYLSSRLSLDLEAAKAWGDHYGVDRGAGRIPAFIEWFREKVDLRHSCGYPYRSGKPYLMELGNHGHLHFGTDTAGAAENGWKPKARMGAGVYPWLGSDRSSLGEQRDNALEARRWFERLFNFTPKSWAMPNRTNDRFTASAMEAAGCEVLSDSNVRTKHNVLLQPPPHHPEGTRAVELTKRYPGDPQHVYHVAMNIFWIHRAHRLGIPVVFMCHQHLRQFDGYACTRFTEYTLRYALSEFSGDLHVNTVYGIGKYWREVLSPQTRRVTVKLEGGRVRIINDGDLALDDLPLDLVGPGGTRFTLLVNVPAGARVEVDPVTGSVCG